MKQGGSKAAERGFTIVETLIVLAVTGALFISAATLISGRQNRTQFTTAINNLQQQLQQVINEATSGYYPNNSAFNCTRQVLTGPSITAAASNNQGSHGDCLFLGKVLYFGNIPDKTQYAVYSVAGNRLNSTGAPAKTLAEAKPVMLAPGVTTNSSAPDLTVLNKFENGMEFVGSGGSLTGTVFALGVLNSVGTASTTDNGTATFGLYAFTGGTWAASNFKDVTDNLDRSAIMVGSLTQVSGNTPYTQFCIASGSTNDSGLFNIDGNLHVSLTVKLGSKTC